MLSMISVLLTLLSIASPSTLCMLIVLTGVFGNTRSAAHQEEVAAEEAKEVECVHKHYLAVLQ